MDEKYILFPCEVNKFKELLKSWIVEAMEAHRQNDAPRRFTIAEAAKELNCSVPTVRNYMKNKRIKFSQVGRKVWFLEPDLRAFIKNEPDFKYIRK